MCSTDIPVDFVNYDLYRKSPHKNLNDQKKEKLFLESFLYFTHAY